MFGIVALLRGWYRRRVFRVGKTVSRFIACDIRRDVIVLSTDRLDAGCITGRVRTTNLLYVSHGRMPQPDFGPPEELSINKIWAWTGQSWGGLANGKSLLDT